MHINAGDFNRRIRIQRYTRTFDNIGNETLSWQDFKTVWAAVNSLYGKEYWEAAAQGAENTIVFTLRFSTALEELVQNDGLTKLRILFDGKPYKIISYDNIDYKNMLIKMKGRNYEGEH